LLWQTIEISARDGNNKSQHFSGVLKIRLYRWLLAKVLFLLPAPTKKELVAFCACDQSVTVFCRPLPHLFSLQLSVMAAADRIMIIMPGKIVS
jgi:hypothetical protein